MKRIEADEKKAVARVRRKTLLFDERSVIRRTRESLIVRQDRNR
jgi:hypothetical protein